MRSSTCPRGTDRLGVRSAIAPGGGQLTPSGSIAWASNLRPGRFVLAVPAHVGDGRSIIAAVPASAPGVVCGDDLRLLGLQASWTAGVRLHSVDLPLEWMTSDDVAAFMPRVRATFLLLQCGLSLGLSRRSLRECVARPAGRRQILGPRVDAAATVLRQFEATIASLTAASGSHADHLTRVLTVRVGLTRLATRAVQLELEATGSEAYLETSGVARRLREAALFAAAVAHRRPTGDGTEPHGVRRSRGGGPMTKRAAHAFPRCRDPRPCCGGRFR